ncbi:hypothetical protein EEL42_13445 [Muribaculaceae bacterium Isolate-100 (HZI)]|nr:hypothetical protein EEL42_13445 [Muribaculaceae bacterium Isolate-100 (HZI)]
MYKFTMSASADEVIDALFRTIIKTDIILRDGSQAQMVTLLSHPFMFEETVMGINKALHSGGKAISWQSKLFRIKDGCLKPSITYGRVMARI